MKKILKIIFSCEIIYILFIIISGSILAKSLLYLFKEDNYMFRLYCELCPLMFLIGAFFKNETNCALSILNINVIYSSIVFTMSFKQNTGIWYYFLYVLWAIIFFTTIAISILLSKTFSLKQQYDFVFLKKIYDNFILFFLMLFLYYIFFPNKEKDPIYYNYLLIVTPILFLLFLLGTFYLMKKDKKMLNFKKTKRKPSFVDMAKVNVKTARELLENGYNGKKVSFSEEDKEMILNAKDDEVVGFVGSDGESYWFINYDYAVKNYEIE